MISQENFLDLIFHTSWTYIKWVSWKKKKKKGSTHEAQKRPMMAQIERARNRGKFVTEEVFRFEEELPDSKKG